MTVATVVPHHRAARVLFTISNPDHDTLSRLHAFKNRLCSYMVYTKKIGRTTSTPYIKGYFILHKPRHMIAVRKLLPLPRIYLDSVKKHQR